MKLPPKDHKCPVCGDELVWVYNHYGTLKGYDKGDSQNDKKVHYPRCPNLLESVMLPLSFVDSMNPTQREVHFAKDTESA